MTEIIGFAVVIGAIWGVLSSLARQRLVNSRSPVFEAWWHTTGSAIRPEAGEDAETHARRVAAHAFDRGFSLGHEKQ